VAQFYALRSKLLLLRWPGHLFFEEINHIKINRLQTRSHGGEIFS
jgi:hypothetical protein